jgi:hypothetical protein
MPHEEKRTRSLHYYVFNLDAFLKIGRLAENLGQNLYVHESSTGSSMLKTLSMLAAYTGRESDWPYEQIGEPADDYLWRVVRRASVTFDSPALEQAERRATARDASDRVTLLTYTSDTQ